MGIMNIINKTLGAFKKNIIYKTLEMWLILKKYQKNHDFLKRWR